MNLNIKYANEKSETKENVTLQAALQVFDEFNWKDEISTANKVQKCSPTIALLLNGHDEMVWVSGFEENGVYKFVSGCSIPGKVSKFFGMFQSDGIINLHAGSFNNSEARKAIELLGSNDHVALRELYA